MQTNFLLLLKLLMEILVPINYMYNSLHIDFWMALNPVKSFSLIPFSNVEISSSSIEGDYNNGPS